MLIVNADDLGMTPGANQAIFDGFDNGGITHASIMANCDYFEEAMTGATQRSSLGIGMHLNLTYGRALIPDPLYTDNNGYFNLGYKTLLLNRSETFIRAVEAEWDAQIQRVLQYNDTPRELTHIDSHRHIHLIPHLYPIVIRLAEKYHINRIRLIKENMWHSLLLTKKYNFFLNGGIVKYLLLRTFSMIDARYHDRYHGIRFYSIPYTGVVGAEILKQLQLSDKTYEIMVHPSYPELDRSVMFYDHGEKTYRISPHRKLELDAILSISKKYTQQ